MAMVASQTRGADAGRHMRQPVTDAQGHFGQELAVGQEDGFEQGGVGRVIRGELGLQSPTEPVQDGGFGLVIQVGMVFDLVDGAHAQIGGPNRLLQADGQADDRDEKSPAGFLEHA